MDALVAKKVVEAKEHVQNAEKRFDNLIFDHITEGTFVIFLFDSLKTSLFKRTPDFDTAASEYGKAGKWNCQKQGALFILNSS
jgi:hypothetical protein